MADIFLIFTGLLLYAYGEGVTEAITFDFRDQVGNRTTYDYHSFRVPETAGIICWLLADGTISVVLLFPLWLLLYRYFFCTERKQFPLWLSIGKQLHWQEKLYKVSIFGKKFNIPWPSTTMQIICAFVGTWVYFII